ncbi:unnamed protein product [Trifolium pratense]|uniref:Uncharacterized protein n=1 Tax=Trifolium pratense TaxID=57577 RepID=A0ACB0M3W0_TRIPR|nr:unnamed protein product [Trifolium pratense]
MDDRLTNYISDRFLKFIEDLVLRDAVRCTENFEATPLVTSSAHSSNGYTKSTSLQPPQVGSDNHEICGTRDINNNSELLLDTVIHHVVYILIS